MFVIFFIFFVIVKKFCEFGESIELVMYFFVFLVKNVKVVDFVVIGSLVVCYFGYYVVVLVKRGVL